MKGFFVTGTDTGIGKTVCSAILMAHLRKHKNICYWKPVQTGIEEDNDTQTVRDLANCLDEEILDAGFRLEKPLSPHLSAQIAGVEITVEKTLQFVKSEKGDRFLIVEGAGGILVPLNDTELIIDLITALKLPVVIVARSGLGTINHTLLTLEALRKRQLDIFGVIINGEPNAENRKAIEHYGKVRVLAEIPKFETINAEILRIWMEQNENAFD